MTLYIRLLGELRVERDAVSQPLVQSRQARGLLAYLAFEPRKQRRDRLCGLIWSTASDPAAGLRWSLSKLRPVLGDALTAEREFVALERSNLQIDAVELGRTLDGDATQPSSHELLRLEHEIAAGYLPGLDEVGGLEFQLWLQSARDSLRQLHGRVLDALVVACELDPNRALAFARQRVALEPSHMPGMLRLLRLSFATGGASQALAALNQLREYCRAERRSEHELLREWHTLQAVETSAPIRVLETEHAPALAIPVPDKPAIAVLGFRDLGAHEWGSTLAEGLTVDLSSRLAQLPQLLVIARVSAACLTAQTLTRREIAARLGVRYLVEGATQRDDRRLRVTVNLLSAENEETLWSERFERRLDDLFTVQDEIVHAIVTAIVPMIERAEMQRALLTPPDCLSAWDAYHYGIWHGFRFTAESANVAQHMFKRAIELDPHFSRAYAGLALAHYQRAFLDPRCNMADEIAIVRDLALQSIDCDARDAAGYCCLSRALYFSRDHDRSLEAIERALEISPNYAVGHYSHGWIGAHGNLASEIVLGAADRAERLSPFDPYRFAFSGIRAVAYANEARYDEAADWAVRATVAPHAHYHMYALSAAYLELCGRSDEARNHAQQLLLLRPDYSVESFQRAWPQKHETREATLAALVRVGIPRGRRQALVRAK